MVLAVVDTETTSSVTSEIKIRMTITPHLSPSSTRTARSETKKKMEEMAVVEEAEVAVAQAEADVVVNAVEVVAIREAATIIREIER